MIEVTGGWNKIFERPSKYFLDLEGKTLSARQLDEIGKLIGEGLKPHKNGKPVESATFSQGDELVFK